MNLNVRDLNCMMKIKHQSCGSEQITRLASETRFRSLLVSRSKLESLFSYVRSISSEASSLILKDNFIEAFFTGSYSHIPCIYYINPLRSKAFIDTLIWLGFIPKLLLPILLSIFLVILALGFVLGPNLVWAHLVC